MTESWEGRRHLLNHRRIQNIMVNRAREAARVANRRGVNSIEVLREFYEGRPGDAVGGMIGYWGLLSKEANALVESFAVEMSPVALFDRVPLCDMDEASQAWMISVVREVWECRHDVSARLGKIHASIAEADRCASKLAEIFRSDWERSVGDSSSPLAITLNDLEQACAAVSAGISALPHTILIP